MNDSIPRIPSVGSLIKKVMAINPELSAPEVIEIIRQSSGGQRSRAHDGFATGEAIDEAKVLRLAKASIKQ